MAKDEYKLLIIVLAGYFLGIAGAPITDPVESNYALTAKEMLLSSDYISPRIYGSFWYDKPVFYYLELILSYAVFGINDFAARLPTALLAGVGIFMTYGFTHYLYGNSRGFAGNVYGDVRALIAAVIVGTSLEYWFIGHAVITDMTLFVAVSGVLMSFFYGYQEKRYNYYLLSFALAGIAVLTKGPIGLCLPGLIILLFLLWERNLKALLNIKILLGFIVFFAIAALWYVPMYLLHGSDFITNFIGVHNVLRATVSEHPDDNVWYYYPAILILGFVPWSLVVIGIALKKWRGLRQNLRGITFSAPTKFLLIWAVTVFIVFQSFATKYVSYTFPYMMPIAILISPLFVARKNLFKRLAIGTLAAYVILLFTVVQPLTVNRSARDIADFIEPNLTTETEVFYFEYKYMTSSVLYTGKLAKKLMTKEAIDRERPDGVSWNSKNVMPMVAYEDFPLDKPVIVISSANALDSLNKIAPDNWEKLGKVSDYKNCYVYYRAPNKN